MLDRKALTWFLVIAFGLAWVLFLLPLAFERAGSTQRQTITLVAWSAAMWAPGIAALIATRLSGRPWSELGLRRLGPKRCYLWAWLLPPALVVATGALTVLLGAGRFDAEFTLIRDALAQAPGAENVSPLLVVAAQSAFAITLAPVVNVPFALGEELGWRGFLLPRLLTLGQGRAIVTSGAVWGFWHAPAILQGLNYPSQPGLGVFLMIGFCLLAGTVLSWLYLRTLSPWAPALGHGSINATGGLAMLFLTGVDLTVGGTIASLIGWIPLGLCVAWLVLTHRLPVPEPSPDETVQPERLAA